MAEKTKLKIVIFGAFGAGKTTLIRTLDPESRHVEANCAGGTTTVALDYGHVQVNGRVVYLFGTPGQERFEFAREIIATGMDGAILLVDATCGYDEFVRHLYDSLRVEKIPFVVMLNKCEMVGAQPEKLKKYFGTSDVWTVSATDRKKALDVLGAFAETLPPHANGHPHPQ
jgi:small GTP-binding protein